jgi:HAD superfamily hydrolase (TIGR01490 family)
MAESTLALFDFDGTITRADTMLELARLHRGTAGYLLTMARLSPKLLIHTAGFLSATRAKEFFLTAFFKGMPLAEFEALCQHFCQYRLPALLRPAALERLQWHQKSGHLVYVVSASARQWLQPWAQQWQLPLLCTELEVANDRITGRLASTNCNGAEKLKRVQEVLQLSAFEEVYVYGDSAGDKELLSIATQPHFKPFRH